MEYVTPSQNILESPRFCTDYERLELRATNADQESRDSEHPNNASSDARWRNIGTYTRTNRISDFSQCEVLDDGHVRNVNGNFYSRLLDESYAMVTLQDQITRDTVTIPVHRLVAIAWVPRYEPGLYVDHINSNRSDSRASNLRWATAQENIAYAQGFPVNAIRKDSPTIKRTFNSMRLASR